MHKEICTIYKQYYLPTMSYPLPATHIPPQQLYTTQSSATTVFLTKLGYPQMFPRSVVYTSHGGMGFWHLGYKQGVQKCLQLVKQMRAGTSMGQVSKIILEHYQLMAGLLMPVLKDTRRLLWSNSTWFDTVRQYLHGINGKIVMDSPWLPIQRRVHNWYIMEDLLTLNLPSAKTNQVQSVCLFLQVTVLSEITNHCGMHLLPRALRQCRPTPNNPYTAQNQNCLLWPYQPAPSPSAWQTWNEILGVLYLKANSYALNQPLGEWTTAYNKDYNWVWQICPRLQILFHLHNGRWIAFTQQQQFDMHIRYQLYNSAANVPHSTLLVTPTILSNSIQIQLPITPVLQSQPMPLQNTPIATRLTTPTSTWASNLWSDIWPHAHTDQLREVLTHNSRIVIVSDAAVHNTGQATCAWVIWAQTELWSSKGYVPGEYDETNSGTAKAYGVATVLKFLSQYNRLYPIVIRAAQTIEVYCDNQGVIERINNHGDTLYPRDTIQDDYPVYADIHQQVIQLCPNTRAFHHVKGHQDQQKDFEMTTPERLNVDCNQRAAQVPIPCPDSAIQQNPLINTAYPHVMVDGQVILRQLTS